MRLVVDTNTWISSLLTPKFRARLEIVFDSAYHLVVSEELFDDLARGMRKPYLAKNIRQSVYKALVSKLHSASELVEVRSVVETCRDPKDNFLLALAKDGNADYLITGDEDLLILQKFGKTKIITLREFELITSNQSRNH